MRARRHGGLKVCGKAINNLRYADNTALIAENKRDLQNLLNVIKNDKERTRLE